MLRDRFSKRLALSGIRNRFIKANARVEPDLLLNDSLSKYDFWRFNEELTRALPVVFQNTPAASLKAAEASKIRVSFVGPQTYDPKGERDALDQAVQKKATGILLAVTDPALLKDSIDKAVAAGVPVITIDSDAPSSKRLFFIGTNNYQAGFTGGLRLAQELKGKGNVVAFSMPDQSNLQERLRAYEQRIGELEKQLDEKGNENRDLIKAKIDFIRHQMEVAGTRADLN